MSLFQSFIDQDKYVANKWLHYFVAYERHFKSWQNKSVNFLEIGVSHGGSLEMWRKYFGPLANIVGIDINPNCKAVEQLGINVRIGSQSDPDFLQSLIDEFGMFDVVLDDGSHRMDDVWNSFQYLYPKMPKNGIYMVEDMHTSYSAQWGGGLNAPDSFINRCKQLIDELNAPTSTKWTKDNIVTEFSKNTVSMSFYESIVVFERGQVPVYFPPEYGSKRV